LSLGQLVRCSGSGPWEEHEVAEVARGILNGLDALHRRGVSHGLLHPDNVILCGGGGVGGEAFESPAEGGSSVLSVVLVDFGFRQALEGMAKRADVSSYRWYVDGLSSLDKDESRRGDSFQEDVWCLGSILCGLLGGRPGSSFSFPTGSGSTATGVSLRLLDFLTACCHVRPRRRPTVQALLQHPLIRPDSSMDENSDEIVAPLRSRLRRALPLQRELLDNAETFDPADLLDRKWRSHCTIDFPILLPDHLDVETLANRLLNEQPDNRCGFIHMDNTCACASPPRLATKVMSESV